MSPKHRAIVNRWVDMLDFVSQQLTFSGKNGYDRTRFWAEAAEHVARHAEYVKNTDAYTKEWHERQLERNAG